MAPIDEQIRTAIAQQAASWFVANRSGTLGNAERAAFVAWLKASPVHVEEYFGVAAIAHGVRSATDHPGLSIESLLEAARAGDAGKGFAVVA
jgi:ferric-dicitrate binding protein FerR (iron transport regulator)